MPSPIHSDQSVEAYWIAAAPKVDVHAFFRFSFYLGGFSKLCVRLGAGVEFVAWMDGAWLGEGPARYDGTNFEYLEVEVDAEPGEHVIALHAHAQGVDTRLLRADVIPFVAVSVFSDGVALSMNRITALLPQGFAASGRRLGCVLSWVEWCDTRQIPASEWKLPGFDDAAWVAPVPVRIPSAFWKPEGLGRLQRLPVGARKVGEGPLVNMSLIDHDPTAGFVTRELEASALPAQGRWFRYDLGRVRLVRVALHGCFPAGAIIQVAYAESLTHGRVSPYLKTGGGSDSCMLDHWVAHGGPQCWEPLHPKGARFIEIHVLTDCRSIELSPELVFWERAYYGEEPYGHFECDDSLLNRIWQVGVDTLRSCAEDAITDNPHRERGQWLGDVVGPGMDILACAYNDWRPLKRGLVQAGECAAANGMVPAIFPGTRQYLPSFAIQWVAAIPRYYRLTGDRALMEELYPVAARNLRAFDPDWTGTGLRVNPDHWNFVDWGYRGAASVFKQDFQDEVRIDPALSLFYLQAIRALCDWSEELGLTEEQTFWEKRRRPLEAYWRQAFNDVKAFAKNGFGYHATTLALAEGLVDPGNEGRAVALLKAHMFACFPNQPDAPRLAATTVETDLVITPFFMHFSLPVLIQAGEVDFVLDQIRSCWGWMLEQGYTTWLEVFDPRWSHCHQWSGCPTWLLSRQVLGLRPRFNLGGRSYLLNIQAGSLRWASGRVPFPDETGGVEVSWSRTGVTYQVKIQPNQPISLFWLNGRAEVAAEETLELELPISAGALRSDSRQNAPKETAGVP